LLKNARTVPDIAFGHRVPEVHPLPFFLPPNDRIPFGPVRIVHDSHIEVVEQSFLNVFGEIPTRSAELDGADVQDRLG
jgi:hypothetical protein